MILRRMLMVLASVAALSSTALAESVTAPGHVVYKMPSGELVTRNVSLEVPARGEGDVFLIAGDQKVKAEAFKSMTLNGRTIFAVLFLNPPGAPTGTADIYLGTYMRGTNEAIYYGDIYKKTVQADGMFDENWDDVTHGVTHVGGFHFSAPVPKPAGE